MAGAFDATLKQLLDTCTPDWIAWLAPLVGLPATVRAQPLDVDLSTVQPAVDKVFQFQPPATGLLHLEVQSSWDDTFPGRLLLYNVLLDERHGAPVHTVVLLLRREASMSGLTGTIVRNDANGREYLRFTYTLVRVWELHADALLAGGLGATPLALITDDAAPLTQETVDRFTERANRDLPNESDATLLISCGYLVAGLRYDKSTLDALFHGAQKMKESSTYQAILEEGVEKGQIKKGQEDVLALLQDRFQSVPPEVEAKIRSMTDLAKLRTALLQVYRVNGPDELPLD